MNIHPSFTILRSATAYEFSSLRMRALRDQFLAKLTGRNSKLMKFQDQVQRADHNRKLLGVQDVRVEQIVGTLNRDCDFDDQFRPLGKHLLERWVNTFISLKHDEWSPILVHKLGEQFFVEDGHHRVSVARSVGMLFITANVWEYHSQPAQTESCGAMPCTERAFSKTYAAG
ncbi:MAG: hypothetical protein ABIQ77_10490 [Anaerolineales bacterium]